MRKQLIFGIVFLIVGLHLGLAYGQQTFGSAYDRDTAITALKGVLSPQQLQQMTPQQLEELRKMSPGGLKKPDVTEEDTRPEFKDLTPEDVKRGRLLLEERERATEKKTFDEEKADRKTLFQKAREIGKYQDISTDLKPFGYEFFKEASVNVITSRKDVPVPLQYVIGPGDAVKILLWGRVNQQLELIVDRDGKISIPQIGPLLVAGMTFEQMSKYIIKQMEQIIGANVDITMGSVKTIPIFVLGDVKRPGAYTIGSFATITDALLLAGGPTEIGSMRKIQLKRKDKVITVFDLYDLLLYGDKSKDKTIQAGDIIFVPVTGPVVGVAGNVKRPAIYELKDQIDLNHLFGLAGGIIPTAYTQQIQVERVVKNEKQVMVDIDDRHLDRSKSFMLQDADLVKVFSIVDVNENLVYLNGNVKKPGKYAYKQGMRVKDLIKDLAELLPDTYFDYALIKRKLPPGLETQLVPFNLGKLLIQNDMTVNIELTPRDSVYIFSKWFLKDKPFIIIEGEIRGDCGVQKRERNGQQKMERMPLQAGYGPSQAGYGPSQVGYGPSQAGYGSSQVGYGPSQADIPAPIDKSMLKELKDVRTELFKAGKTDLARKVKSFEDKLEAEARIPAKELRDIHDELGQIGRFDLAEKMRSIEDKHKEDISKQFKELREVQSELERSITPKFELVQKLGIVEDELRKFGFIPQKEMREVLDELVKMNRFELAEKLRNFEKDLKKSCRLELSENTRVKDMILNAGGLTHYAYLERGEVIRVNNKRDYQTFYFNVAAAMADNPLENLLLQNEDRIVIHSLWEMAPKQTVTVSGDVNKPGNYQYTDQMSVRDLVFKAGNVLESAYLDDAELSSVVADPGRGTKLENRNISLRRALAGDAGDNLALKPYDRLLVKRIPNFREEKFITLTGEFKFPGKYILKKGERLSSVIERAGGYTDKAYFRAAFFARERVREMQQKGLEEMASRLERELMAQGGASAAKALSVEEIKGKEIEMAQKQKFIESLRKLKASGRMSIRLANLRLLKGSLYDLELEDGDMLSLPEKNSVVNVTGAVMATNSMIYVDQWDYKDYIAMCGGYSNYADPGNAFVLKVDGTAYKLSKGFFQWSDNKSRWELASFGDEIRQIEAGDTIVVPDKTEQIAWLREIRDITQILMNTAVTAGVVIKLF